jgi:hypothetical protein
MVASLVSKLQRREVNHETGIRSQHAAKPVTVKVKRRQRET